MRVKAYLFLCLWMTSIPATKPFLSAPVDPHRIWMSATCGNGELRITLHLGIYAQYFPIEKVQVAVEDINHWRHPPPMRNCHSNNCVKYGGLMVLRWPVTARNIKFAVNVMTRTVLPPCQYWVEFPYQMACHGNTVSGLDVDHLCALRQPLIPETVITPLPRIVDPNRTWMTATCGNGRLSITLHLGEIAKEFNISTVQIAYEDSNKWGHPPRMRNCNIAHCNKLGDVITLTLPLTARYIKFAVNVMTWIVLPPCKDWVDVPYQMACDGSTLSGLDVDQRCASRTMSATTTTTTAKSTTTTQTTTSTTTPSTTITTTTPSTTTTTTPTTTSTTTMSSSMTMTKTPTTSSTTISTTTTPIAVPSVPSTTQHGIKATSDLTTDPLTPSPNLTSSIVPTTSSRTQKTTTICKPYPVDCPSTCATFNEYFCPICDYSICNVRTAKPTTMSITTTTMTSPITKTSTTTYRTTTNTKTNPTTTRPSTPSKTTTGMTMPTTTLPTTTKTTSTRPTANTTTTETTTPTTTKTTPLVVKTSLISTTITPSTTSSTTTSTNSPTTTSTNSPTLTPAFAPMTSVRSEKTTTVCKPYPVDCPSTCATFNEYFCPICDYSICNAHPPSTTTAAPDTCPQLFCVLNCGNPPKYKKDRNGCPKCECEFISN